MKGHHPRGLSLLELLIVVAIMALAMGILFAVLSKAYHVINGWRSTPVTSSTTHAS